VNRNVPARARDASEAMPVLVRWGWIQSALVILALLLLFIVPTIVDHRVTALRNELLVGEHARVLVNDLEASFASALLAQNGAQPRESGRDVKARVQLDADNAELRTTAHELGPQAAEYYDALSEKLRAWDLSPHGGDALSAQQGLDLLASAERFDAFLTSLVTAQRQRATRLARLYVLAPAVLAPIALLAMLAVIRSARRVAHLAHIANEERAAVIRASESRAALLRGVTHDVKNPLGAAAGYAQLLEEGIVGPLTPEQTEMVRRIHRLVGVSVQTVSDLLELARVDGQLHLEYQATDLAVILAEVVDDHRGMAQEHQLSIVVNTMPTPVVTDAGRARQIVANLLTNAIKYTPSGGRITVSIVAPGESADGRAGAVVQDTGPGIPAELQSRVFEEFFRVRGTAGDSPDGNGLGLAISRRIARLLGGDVTFAPAQEGGSVFTAWFPAARGISSPA
jgi:signal transduction histidine kinase